jgi:predicted RNase H-like nuclease
MLIIGFDSAWTAGNKGGLVGALHRPDGGLTELGEPEVADFSTATDRIRHWQATTGATQTLILLDQPTIVRNATGQRPVENLVGAAVSRRRGGVQPAFTGRQAMFGPDAPVWPFLGAFSGAADPRYPPQGTAVLETYPVLALIALGWLQPDTRPGGRLPKYNPGRRKTFQVGDWRFVCERAAKALVERGATATADWLRQAALDSKPGKALQDRVDACLCLLVGLELALDGDGLMVGQIDSGYMVVPYREALATELQERCVATGRVPAEWVWRVRWAGSA